MNVLVTGHNGFIGRNLVKELLNNHYRVFVLNIKNRKNTIPGQVTSINFDETKIEDFIKSIRINKIEGVFHLASKFIVKHKPDQVAELIDSNLKFGAIILDSSAMAKVKWFLNTGSYWQYRNGNGYSPVNLYAAVKQGFQSIAKYYFESGAIKFTTLILFDTYGPGDSRPKLLNLWNKISTTGESLKMSDGQQILKINFIDDVTSAYLTLADLINNQPDSIQNGEIFSLDSNENFTLKQLSEIFENTLDRKLNIKWGVIPHNDKEILNPVVVGKILPGWSPKTSLKEGIKKSFLKSGL